MEREKAKEILLFFRDIDNKVALNARVKSELEEKYYSVGGGHLDSMPKNSRKISRPTEMQALNVPNSVTETLRELSVSNDRLSRLKKEILNEFNKLPYLQQIIIYDFYIVGHQWVQISKHVHYSIAQCKNIRNRGLDRLADYFSSNKTIFKYCFPN